MSSHTEKMIATLGFALVFLARTTVASAAPAGDVSAESELPSDPEAALAVDAGAEPAVEGASPPEPPSEETRNAQALAMYNEQRYADAIRAYEALYSEFGSTKYLYNIAISHDVLGHDAYAYVYFRRCQASEDLTADMAAEIRARMDRLRRRTIVMRVQAPGGMQAPGTRLTLLYRNLHQLTDPERPPLTLSVDMPLFIDDAGDAVLHVEPGLWQTEVTTPGRPAHVGRIEIANKDVRQVVLQLDRPQACVPQGTSTGEVIDEEVEAKRQSAEELRDSRRLAGGLGIVSLLALGGGATTLVLASDGWTQRMDGFLALNMLDDASAGFNDTWNAKTDWLHKRLLFQAVGSVVAGGGVGIGITGLLALKPHRPRVWVIPMLIGGAAIAGGFAGSNWHTGKFFEYDSDLAQTGTPLDEQRAREYEQSYQKRRTGLLLTTAAAGAGMGIVVGSMVGMIYSSVKKRRGDGKYSLHPQVGPTSAGFMLFGRF